jgi:hypothetical protein
VVHVAPIENPLEENYQWRDVYTKLRAWQVSSRVLDGVIALQSLQLYGSNHGAGPPACAMPYSAPILHKCVRACA